MNIRLRLINCLIVCFSFFQFSLNAQSVSTVGKGNSSTEKFPFNGYYDFSWASTIYEAKDINNLGRLTEISFFVNNSPSNFIMNNQKIFVRTTNNTGYTDGNYPTTSGFTLVFEGTISYNGYGKVTIPLNTPFNYNGSSNLEFLFENRDGTYNNGFPYFSYTRTTDGRLASKRDYKDGNFPSTCYNCRTVSGFADIEMKFEACDFLAGNIVTSNNNIKPGSTTQINLVGHLSSASLQWQSSKDNINFVSIPSATSGKFVTPVLYSNTFYRVKLTSGNCSMYSPVFEVTIDPSFLVTKTVGKGTDEFDKYPFYGYYNYSWSSMILKANEIESSGRMTSISLQVANNPGITMEHQKIYVRHTSDKEYSNDTYPGTNGFQLVFDGTITYTKSGWKEIIFDQTFMYNGVDNLEFLFENHDGSYSSNYPYFVGTRNVASYQIKRDYQDPSFPSSCISCRKYMNSINMQLKFVPCQVGAGSISTDQTLIPIGDNYELVLNNESQGITIAWQRKSDLNAFETIANSNQRTFASMMLGAPVTYRALITNGCSNYTNEITLTPDACFSDTIIIADSTRTTNKYPFNGYYDYSWSSAIYKASEINHPAGRMASIQFNVTNSPVNFRMDNQKIYVRHTQENAYTDNAYVGTTGFTLIYEGAITYNGQGWMEIPFSTFFEYDGTSNLEFLFESRDGSYGMDYPTFEYTNGKSEARVKRDYQDYSFPTNCVRCRRFTNLPNVKFKFLPQPGFEGELTVDKTSLCVDEAALITLNNSLAGLSITWESALDDQNFQPIPNQTSSTFKVQNLNTSTYFRSVVSEGTCARPSESILIEAYCPVVSSFDPETGTGNITVDISGITPKVGPYHYLISESEIPDLLDSYYYLRDSIGGDSLDVDSLSFFRGRISEELLRFENYQMGKYFVSVFDNSGNRILDKQVVLLPNIELEQNQGIVYQKGILSATEDNSKAVLKAYITELTSGELTFQLNNVTDEQYIGFIKGENTLTSKSSLDYGFLIKNSSIYTIEMGKEVLLNLQANASDYFTFKQERLDIHYFVNGNLVKRVRLPEKYILKGAAGISRGGMSMGILPKLIKFQPFFLRTKLINGLNCDGQLGKFSFSLGSDFKNIPPNQNYTITSVKKDGINYPGSNGSYYSYGTAYPMMVSEAGVYTIYGNILYNGLTYYFSSSVTVGYDTEWSNDYLSKYSTLASTGNTIIRTDQSVNTFSIGLANNLLDSQIDGWIEFTPTANLTSNNSGFNYFTLLSQSQNLNVPFNSETYLRFRQVIAPNKNGTYSPKLEIRWNSANGTGIKYVALNSLIRITIIGSSIRVYANGVLVNIVSIQRPQGSIYLKANTLKQNDGFKNIITSFGCLPKTRLKEISHSELKRDLNAGYALAVESKVKFTFDEEYKITPNQFLNYKLYNDHNDLLASCDGLGNAFNGAQVVNYQFDDNRYVLDLSNITPSLTTDNFYILEITTTKGDKRYLRILFKY
jgi:hypothetical protein